MKVLIVDDSAGNLKLLRVILEAENFQVVEARDGIQALGILEQESVDAIISDILMPRMDGYRLCYEVRKNERWQTLPFIFYTATYTSPSDERLSYHVGGDKYLQKPASAQAILSALREVTNAATRSRPQAGILSETDVMKEYSERLVSKLEAKNVELSEAKKKLEETNRQLERAGVQLRQVNQDLELRVQQRTSELQTANKQLEAFSYSVSHDLRAPLRHIEHFSAMVLRDCASQLDETGAKHLRVIQNSAVRMTEMIEAMLELSQVTRARLHRQPVNLSALATEVLAELQQSQPERTVQIKIAPNVGVTGDHRLLRIALTDLLNNAWKFTAKRSNPLIEFGRTQHETGSTYFVRDDGVGFDMAYVDKLFSAFQRLHRHDEFEGSGIGLATVRRVIERHGGKVWAEGAPDHGATFYFTLGET